MVHVGLVGCGAIGSQLALAIDRTYRGTARLVALHDVDDANACRLQRRLTSSPLVCSLPVLIRRSHVVVEAASVEAARRAVPAALRAGRSVLVMSVGALLEDVQWRRLAQRRGGKVFIPSGALAGIDALKAMAVGTVRRVRLTTRKPPKALQAAPYVQRKRLDLLRRRSPQVIFEGSARDAVRAFPQNANVAATLVLASRSSRVRMRMVSDPTIRSNIHDLEVVGDCGRLRCRIESRPSRANPKTSELAVRSAVAALESVLGSVALGS